MYHYVKIIQKSRKEEVTFLFPVWDRWNHNKYLVQITNPVIAISYNKLWWPSGKDTWLSHRQSGFKSRWDLFEEKFFLCLCFTTKLIPESRNLYLSTPMDDFSKLHLVFEFRNSSISLQSCQNFCQNIILSSKYLVTFQYIPLLYKYNFILTRKNSFQNLVLKLGNIPHKQYFTSSTLSLHWLNSKAAITVTGIVSST